MSHAIALKTAAHTKHWVLRLFEDGSSGLATTIRWEDGDRPRLPTLDWPADLFAANATAADLTEDTGPLAPEVLALSRLFHSDRAPGETSH